MYLKKISFVILFFSIFSLLSAQEDQSTNKEQLEILHLLSRIKFTGLIQGQFQYGQPYASLKVGEANENLDESFNRIGIRRGIFGVAYEDGISKAVVQLFVNEDEIWFRDIYLNIKDPWVKQNSLTAGFFHVPFGFEVAHSGRNLESMERATVIQQHFPQERDLGVMLTLRAKENSPLHFFKIDLAVISGNGLHRDTDNRKNFVGRIRASKTAGNGFEWGAGFSYYWGYVMNTTAVSYKMRDGFFEQIGLNKEGTYMKREYFGLDAQLTVPFLGSQSTFRAEGLIGTQPGLVNSVKSPTYSSRPPNTAEYALYQRPFLGYYLTYIQKYAKTRLSSVIKYEVYDPNTKVKGAEVGLPNSYTTKTDLKREALGLGLIYDLSTQIKLQAYYEFVFKEKAPLLFESDKVYDADVFTLRLQYSF
jgi:hypothetical protein